MDIAVAVKGKQETETIFLVFQGKDHGLQKSVVCSYLYLLVLKTAGKQLQILSVCVPALFTKNLLFCLHKAWFTNADTMACRCATAVPQTSDVVLLQQHGVHE